jgi:small subunit ribosomal protein S16
VNRRRVEVVKIRLKRMGATKRPFYRVVVADSRSPRDGRFIENIGKYHPLEEPSLIQIDEDRALYWLSQGAQPTEQVQNLLRLQGIWERFESSPKPKAGAARTTVAPQQPEQEVQGE